MRLDLTRLSEMHPLLPQVTAAEYVHRAAIALQRRHAPGVSALAILEGQERRIALHWTPCSTADAEQLDRHRVTEDGAEAIALALAHAAYGWVVRRRLQRGDFADWLLVESARSRLVALEISGTDDADDTQRMREELEQVAQCSAAGQRAACVVRFLEPRAAVELVP